MLLGSFGRPRLLVPQRLWAHLDDRQRDALLLHELAHMRRLDHWVRGVELLATVVYWWNPLVWLARRQLRIAEELCCDAWVTHILPAGRDDYAAALVEAIDFASASRPALPLLASGVGEFKHLQRRLLMIRNGTSNREMGWTSVVGLGVLLALPLSLTRAQQSKRGGMKDSAATSSPTNQATASQPSEREVNNSAESLRGTWTIVSSTGDPRSGHVFERAGTSVVIADDVMVLEGILGLEKKTIVLGEDAPVRSIELRPVPGVKSWSRFGVFQIRGDTMLLSVNFPGAPRPLSFEKISDGREIVALKRTKNGDRSNLAAPQRAAVPANDQNLHEERRVEGAPAIGPKVQSQLDRVLPSVSFRQTALGDAVDFLRDFSDAQIVVNWAALKRAGVDRRDPVNLQLKDVTLRKVLDVLVQRLGDGDVRGGWIVDGSSILIETESEIAKEHLETRVYDVRDIVVPTDIGHQKAADDLIKSIIDNVDTASWRETGGTVGSLRELQGQLVVTQTPENQRQILDLLKNYRQTHGLAPATQHAFPTTRPNAN